MTYSLPSKPLTIKEVLGHSFVVFKKSLPRMSGLLGLYLVFLIGFSVVLSQVLPLQQLTRGKQLSSATLLIFLSAHFILWLCNLWFSSARFYQINQVMQGLPVQLGTSMLRACRKLPVLIFAALFGLIATTLGSTLLIIPGVFLLLLYLFFTPLVVLDNCKVLPIFDSAYGLIKGNWWRTFSVLLLPCLLIVVSLLAVTIPVFLLMTCAPNSLPIILALVTLNAILALVFFIVVPVYFDALILVQLHNLKLRRVAARTNPTSSQSVTIPHG